MDNPLSNVYTDRDFQYLKSKSLDVCIVVRHRGTKEVTMRSSVPHSEAVKMIRGMENTKEDTWVTEAQKNRFPKSPEPLEDILNCKPKIQKLASQLMSFWNSGVRGRQAMGVGEFKAWNDFEFDLGKTHFLINQFDKIRNDVDKFSLKMVDVIEWKELACIFRQNCITPPFGISLGHQLFWDVSQNMEKVWDGSQVKAFPNPDQPPLAIFLACPSFRTKLKNLRLFEVIYQSIWLR